MTMQTHATKRDGKKLPPRYRLMMFQKPIGPWRPTIADAKADAIRAGTADYDHDRRVVFLTVPAWIEMGVGDAEPLPALSLPWPARRPGARRGGGR